MVCVLIEAPKRIFHFVDSNPTFWGGSRGGGAGKKGVKLNFQNVCLVGYQTLAFDTTNLSKLFMIQIHSAFGLQRPQWRVEDNNEVEDNDKAELLIITDLGGQVS